MLIKRPTKVPEVYRQTIRNFTHLSDVKPEGEKDIIKVDIRMGALGLYPGDLIRIPEKFRSFDYSIERTYIVAGVSVPYKSSNQSLTEVYSIVLIPTVYDANKYGTRVGNTPPEDLVVFYTCYDKDIKDNYEILKRFGEDFFHVMKVCPDDTALRNAHGGYRI